MNKRVQRRTTRGCQRDHLAVCLFMSLMGAAFAQDAVGTALSHTYGAPTLLSQGFGTQWNVVTRYTAAAFHSRRGPDLVIVREEGGGPPIPSFRLSASLGENTMPLGDVQRFSRYEVDRLEVVTGPEARSAWAISRLTCICSHQAIYLAIEPTGLINSAAVSILVLDERQAPYQIGELPDVPSPVRSLLGLAATDGYVRLSHSPTIEPLPITRWFGNFVPDPTADCVVCAPSYREHDAIEIYLIRHHGAIDYSNRTPMYTGRTGRFAAYVIHSYTRLKDTLVIREQYGRVSLLYQYSQAVIRESTWPEPLVGGYFWPDSFVDVDDDGYPELIGSEACHCEMAYPYFAVMDLRNREVVFVEYTGGPGLGPDDPDVIVPYIRVIADVSSKHARMQEELVSYLSRASVVRAREPADSKPLGHTNDIRVGRLEAFP